VVPSSKASTSRTCGSAGASTTTATDPVKVRVSRRLLLLIWLLLLRLPVSIHGVLALAHHELLCMLSLSHT
jgi:hypothetical protein